MWLTERLKMTNSNSLSLIVGQTVTVTKNLGGKASLIIVGTLTPLFEGYYVHKNGVCISFSADDLASAPSRNGTTIDIFLK